MNLYDPEAVIQEFCANKTVELFFFSDDDLFSKTVRDVFSRTLEVKGVPMSHYRDSQKCLDTILDRTRNGLDALVFVERKLDGVSSADFILALAGAVPSARILCLTDESSKDDHALMYELGAAAILTRPASQKDIIEKIATMVNPPHKLAKVICRSRQLMTKGRYTEVLQACDKVMEIKPDSAGVNLLRGEALLSLGRFEDGLAALEQANSFSPLYIEPMERLARAWLGRDEAKRLHWLERIDAISPRNLRRKYDMGRICVRLGRVEAAEKYFTQAMKLAKENTPFIVSQVAIDISEVVPEKSLHLAEAFLQDVIANKGDGVGIGDMPLFNRLGLALRRQGKWQEAQECYAKALEISPEDEGLHYNMAMVLFESGEYQTSLACLEKALGLNPLLGINSRNISVNIARIFQRAGQNRKAVEYLERAVDLEPDDESLKLALEQARRAT